MDSTSVSLDWRNLFVGSKNQSLDFFPHEIRDGVVTVKPPIEVIEEGIADWNNALVGQFIGAAPRFSSMQRIIDSIWENSSQVKVSLAGPNLYVFSFLDANLRDWVLENGPWHVQNKPLVLRRWEPGLQSLNFDLALMPVWVQLYNIPLELYSQKGLSYIASALGTPLYMDTITASRERLEFAKLCIKIEAGSVLPEDILVTLRDRSTVSIKVHVPWMPHLKKSKSGGRKKVFFLGGTGSKDSLNGNAEASGQISDSLPGSSLGGIHGSNLQVGVIMESSVHDLQEPSVATQATGLGTDSLPTVTADKSAILNAEGVVKPCDFPSLQDSLKKKTRGKKKEPVGSSNKPDYLVDGLRKTRVASLGVAMLLNEIKAKKRGHLDKTKSNVVNLVDVICLMESRIRRENSVKFSSALSADWNLAISIIGNITGLRTVITAVYGSNFGVARRGLWEHLRTVENDLGSSSWVIGGDFNIIARAEESSDFETMGVHNSSDMKEFQDCLEELDLMDHPFLGPTFTWSNRQEGSFLARKLDRVLVNPKWLLDYPDSFVEFKAQGVSDHCLGVLWTHKGALAKKPRPFKFFNCWVSHEKFLSIVKDSWQVHCAGSAMQVLFCKLRRLKPLLKELNKEFFSDISGRVKGKRAELEQLQIFNLTHAEQRRVAEEKRIQDELVNLEVAESEFFRQKAKLHWLDEGDLNTKFFHQRVESNKKKKYH
ncbi:uncharacterized protein LOC120175552 [Hibiscus syriacus]|uniref:uncharacterized protein LOC120175552 n=1 Tax=Hibiscus syriacus TaxID=106335 RepID=UPI001924892B|nr:uncharacterized protein LOC120175552 [Hibiscus syriacus]